MNSFTGINTKYFSKCISQKSIEKLDLFSTFTFTKLSINNFRVDFVKVSRSAWLMFDNLEPIDFVSNDKIYQFIISFLDNLIFDTLHTDNSYISSYNILKSEDLSNQILRKEFTHYEQ